MSWPTFPAAALAAFVSNIFYFCCHLKRSHKRQNQTTYKPASVWVPNPLHLPPTPHPTVSIFVSHLGLPARLWAFLSVRQTNMAALTSFFRTAHFLPLPTVRGTTDRESSGAFRRGSRKQYDRVRRDEAAIEAETHFLYKKITKSWGVFFASYCCAAGEGGGKEINKKEWP